MNKDEVKLKKCASPGCQNQFKPYLSTDRYCSSKCTRDNKKKPTRANFQGNIKPRQRIKRRSVKGTALDREYARISKEFLSAPGNEYCPITCGKATEVHHKRKRVGYADQWARENNIPLLVDVRFFLAVSRAGHEQIENNPEWAYKMGYSIRTN